MVKDGDAGLDSRGTHARVRGGGGGEAGTSATEAWRRYCAARPALRLAWPSADIVVPDLLLFERRATGERVVVLAWQERVSSLIIPEAAERIVLRSDPLSRRRDDRAPILLMRSEVVAVLGERARRYEVPVPHWLYRGGEAHPLLLEAVRALRGAAALEFRAARPDDERGHG